MCVRVYVFVCVSKHEMQQLVLFQQAVEECSLQSAMRWMSRALCFVFCVCVRVCVNTHVGEQLLLFNETTDRSQRGYTLTLVFEQQV